MAPFLARRDGRRVAARVLDSDVELDVAVLSVEEPLDAHLEWVDLDTLREGDPVISLGYPAPFNEYAVSPGTLLSFIVEDGRRIGVVSDESSDYGSSGGPLLTADGHIIGVVTEFVDAELSGQTNGQSYTYDRLGDFIEQAKQAEPKAELTCDGFEYGTNEIADSLWDLCADERYWACDSLYDLDQYLPVGGEYSDFGATCGDRVETDRYCVEEFGTMNPLQYGDDPFLSTICMMRVLALMAMPATRCGWQQSGSKTLRTLSSQLPVAVPKSSMLCGVATSSLNSPMTPDLPMMTTAVPHEAERRGSWPADISPPT